MSEAAKQDAGRDKQSPREVTQKPGGQEPQHVERVDLSEKYRAEGISLQPLGSHDTNPFPPPGPRPNTQSDSIPEPGVSPASSSPQAEQGSGDEG